MTPHKALFGHEAIRVIDTAMIAILCKDLQLDPSDYNSMSLDEWTRTIQNDTKKREALHLARELRNADVKKGKVADLKRFGRPKVGDLVAIRSAPRKISVPQAKITPPWIAPFVIVWMAPDGLSMRLEYEPDRSISLERSAVDIKRFFRDENSADVLDTKDQEDFTVESVLAARGEHEDGSREYFISWVGFPPEFNCWVDAESLFDEDLKRDADIAYPSDSELAIAKESMPTTDSNAQWMRNLKPDQIISADSYVHNRRGGSVVLTLKGEKLPRRVPISSLPDDVRKMPIIDALLKRFGIVRK
jgi:hypothetical protein